MKSFDNFNLGRCRRRLSVYSICALCALSLGCVTYRTSELTPAATEQWLANSSVDRDSLSTNRLVRFRWELREPDLRMDGLGVIRLGVPDKVRVDLFLENGESVLGAALVGNEIRVGEGQPYLEAIPAPPLLWAALGLFKPGQESVLVRSERLGTNEIKIEYSISSTSQISYDIFNNQIRSVSILENGRTIHSMRLELETLERLPSRATYRNLNSYRELVMILDTVDGVEPYDERIWSPGD
ncbi:MAG: hypothetical protein OSA24_05680 [Longimicrobiales bacterium]|nr:hypothetical protein [Longimicrobiales bacterium]